MPTIKHPAGRIARRFVCKKVGSLDATREIINCPADVPSTIPSKGNRPKLTRIRLAELTIQPNAANPILIARIKSGSVAGR